jgi:hypothetical protein
MRRSSAEHAVQSADCDMLCMLCALCCAAMLESAGLLEDALREYSELEACYLEALRVGTGWRW